MKVNALGKVLCTLAVGFFCLNSTAQNEYENLKKYWNYREKFKKNFVKIGSSQGEGINVSNIDTVNSHLSAETGYSWTNMHPKHGYKRWGDAMALQGDYISVLASEYKLLKDAGKNVTAVLNELYYSIYAVERLDKVSETYFDASQINFNNNFNGFFIRDDVDSSTTDNWENEYSNTLDYRDRCDGVKSDYYIDHLGSNFNMNNEMSQDQMFGLWQGFLHVIKLVDNVYVKPTPSDNGFYLHDKVKELTNKMFNHISADYYFQDQTIHLFKFNVAYLNTLSQVFAGVVYPIPAAFLPVNSTCNYTQNWVLVNPVFNKKVENGSEMRPFAYPIAKTAEIISGIPYSQGAGVTIDGNDILGDGNVCLLNNSHTISLSNIQTLMWNPIQNITWDPAYVNGVKMWCFNIDASGIAPSLASNALNYCVEEDSIKNKLPSYNVFMALQLATMSQSWTKENVVRIADSWHMEIFDLMYAVLNNTSPVHTKQYWDSILVTAPCNGPYNYNSIGGSINSALMSGDWNENTRWAGNNGPSGFTRGEYNGNDYMLAYNLYRIAFADQLNQDEYNDISCPCENSPKLQANMGTTSNVLLNNTTVKRKFANDYMPIGIKLKEYSIRDLIIISNKQLNVETDLVVCNNTQLTAYSFGKVIVGSPTVSDASIIVREGSTLALGINGKLIINDNCKVIIEKGAKLIYNSGAEIQLLGDNAVLEIQGELVLGNNAVFKFSYPGTNSGYVKFAKPDNSVAPYDQIRVAYPGQTASIELKGKAKTDKILEIDQDLLQISISNGISTFKIENGTVNFSYNKGLSYISSDVNLRLYNSKFIGAPNIPGSGSNASVVAVWGQPQCQISSCEFSPNVSLWGNLFAYGNKLTVNNSQIYGSIKTQGKGVYFNNVTTPSFTAELASVNSQAINCKFSDGVGVQLFASPVEFDFNNCKANNNYTFGYDVEGPSLLKVKCGQVKENQYAGFHMAKSSSLSMNVTDGGGYVDATNNIYTTIYLDQAHSIDIDNGYNDLRPYDFNSVTSTITNGLACKNYGNCGYIAIEGTVKQLPGAPISVNNNRWQANVNNTTYPLQTTFGKDKYTNVVSTFTPSATNANINFTAISQSPRVACDYWDPGCINCPKSFLEVCPTCNVINTADFLNQKTNDAVKETLVKMDSSIVNSNKDAVNMFYQILKYPLPVPTAGDKYVSNIAEKKMMVAFASAIEKKEIVISDSIISPDALKALDLAQEHFNKAHAEGNYIHEFQAILEKILVFYSIDRRSDAVAVIDQYENVLQPEDKEYMSKLKCQISNEMKYLTKETSQFEYLKLSQQCPTLIKKQFDKRIVLFDSNEVQNSEDLKTIAIYPNPAQNKLFIELPEILSGQTMIRIIDVAGKVVIEREINNKKEEINDLNLSNGIYFYSIINNTESIQQGKLSIIK